MVHKAEDIKPPPSAKNVEEPQRCAPNATGPTISRTPQPEKCRGKRLYNGSRGMGRNKDLRKKIAGEERTRLDHERKLRLELAKAGPDTELIEYWRREINAATKRQHC